MSLYIRQVEAPLFSGRYLRLKPLKLTIQYLSVKSIVFVSLRGEFACCATATTSLTTK